MHQMCVSWMDWAISTTERRSRTEGKKGSSRICRCIQRDYVWKGVHVVPVGTETLQKVWGDRCHKCQKFLQAAALGTSTCLLFSPRFAYLDLFSCPFIATISSSLPLEVHAAFSQVSSGMAAQAFISQFIIK